MSPELPSEQGGWEAATPFLLDTETRLSQLLEVSIWIAQCKLEGRRWWVIATSDGGLRIADDDDEWD